MSQNCFVQNYSAAFIDYIKKGKKHYFYQISSNFRVQFLRDCRLFTSLILKVKKTSAHILLPIDLCALRSCYNCHKRRKKETILMTTSGQFPLSLSSHFFPLSLSAAFVLIKRCSSPRQRDKAFLGKLCSASLFWITKLRTQKYLRIGIITCSLFTGYSDSVLLFLQPNVPLI